MTVNVNLKAAGFRFQNYSADLVCASKDGFSVCVQPLQNIHTGRVVFGYWSMTVSRDTPKGPVPYFRDVLMGKRQAAIDLCYTVHCEMVAALITGVAVEA